VLLAVAAWFPCLSGVSGERAERSSSPVIHREARLLGTVVAITALGPGANAAVDAAFAEIERCAAPLDYFDPASEVSLVSAAAGRQPRRVGRETMDVIRAGIRFGRESDGAFDITVGPLAAAWGMYGPRIRVPAADEIERCLGLVGYGQIHVDAEAGTVLLTKPGMRLDLGGLAKGYLIDRAIELMALRGIRGALVDAGGDIRVLGGRPGGGGWRIAVSDPSDPIRSIGVVEIIDGAIATSAVGRRLAGSRGEAGSRVLDPRTGRLVESCRSATVSAKLAMDADALATAVLVLGPANGLELIEGLPGVEALVVAADGGHVQTSGFGLLAHSGLACEITRND